MAHPSARRLLTLHALRLKGIAEPAAVAALFSLDEDDVVAELAELERSDLVRYRHGRMPGWSLTPEGTAYGEKLLGDELDEAGARETVERAYGEFLTFNDDLLAVCTAWQLRTVDGVSVVNDHADVEYDRGVHMRLQELHARIEPVLDALAGALTRFAGHGRRLRNALAKVVAGDNDYFTKPMFPSYHSAWFELHEDLLATLGRQRGETH